MSAPGPESTPTSADPRSKRPTKRRALTPLSAQKSTLEALFSKPDQDIRIPNGTTTTTTTRHVPAPPEIVTNVQGSSAGAGSGEFHVYKAARRREYERLRVMDEEVRREQGERDFAARRDEARGRDEERTRRNRERREKAKARKAAGKGNKGAAAGGGVKARVVAKDGGGGDGEDDAKMEVDDSRKEDGAGASSVSASAAATDAPGLVIHEDD